MEEFRVLKRNENYKVSNIGRIYSVRKDVIMTNKLNHDGYMRIQLYNKGKCEYVSIHRLVAEEFIGNIPVGYVINHKDLDKSNNRVDNLEIVTQSENIRHAIDKGVFDTQSTSKKCVVSDGTSESVYKSATKCAEDLGISWSYVARLCRENKIWRGLKFRYL